MYADKLGIFRLDFVSSNYILTYILGVMYINVFTSGLVYGVVASLFSVMLVNYMFIAPLCSSASGQTTW